MDISELPLQLQAGFRAGQTPAPSADNQIDSPTGQGGRIPGETEMGYAILGLVLLGLALSIWLIVQAATRHRERVNQIMQQVGFFEVSRPDSELVDRLRSLLSRTSKQVTIGRVFRYSGNWCDLYMLDPRPTDGAGRAVIVRSERLNLPRMVISPRVPLGGTLGQLLNKLTEHVLSRTLPKVSLERHPDLAAKYMVFSDRPELIQPIIERDIVRFLLDAPCLFSLSAEGDTLVVARINSDFAHASRRHQRLDSAELRLLTDDAQRLFDLLSRSGVHAAPPAGVR